jgi:curved DNA-binding protein CbpA
MNQDYYETLQVHPRADQDAIAAAYRRLQALYDPARLEGAADELVALARQKRDAIERAYSVLSDPQRRASYDAELATRQPVVAGETPPEHEHVRVETLDYHPLPPARGHERPRNFDAQPVRATYRQQAKASRSAPAKPVSGWLLPVLLLVAIALVVGGSYLITSNVLPAQSAAEPTQPVALADQMATAIASTKAATDQNPNDAGAWIDYANALYDSVAVVRENVPDSPMYQQLMPRWKQAADAYDKAIQLGADDPLVRSDMGVSLCYYGAGTGDQSIVRQGADDARKAEAAASSNARVLLNLGNCLVSLQPPQTQDAIAAWKRVEQGAAADSPEVTQAKQLIARYE